MEVGLVGNTLNSSWLKYLSIIRVDEEICLAKHTFSGHGMSTQYYTIKIQIMAFGRSEVSTANREGSPWTIRYSLLRIFRVDVQVVACMHS